MIDNSLARKGENIKREVYEWLKQTTQRKNQGLYFPWYS